MALPCPFLLLTVLSLSASPQFYTSLFPLQLILHFLNSLLPLSSLPSPSPPILHVHLPLSLSPCTPCTPPLPPLPLHTFPLTLPFQNHLLHNNFVCISHCNNQRIFQHLDDAQSSANLLGMKDVWNCPICSP